MAVKIVAAAFLVVVLAASFWFVWRGRTHFAAAREKASPQKSDQYLDMRSRALTVSRSQIGLPAVVDSNQPWGVLMDWNVSNGTATVLAMSDGSASVYLSSGGGLIGGIGQENIRASAKRAVGIAGDVQPEMRLTKQFPLPKGHDVIFYLLTDAGVYTAVVTEEELKTNQHRLSRLGNAMQDVVTQYRLWSEQKASR